jgi:WD40 repeat protein
MSKMSQAKPQPVNILRGHRSQVHSTEFIRGNARLATGDADGYVVLWDLGTMRPTAVWRAHKNSILSIREWGDDKLIT